MLSKIRQVGTKPTGGSLKHSMLIAQSLRASSDAGGVKAIVAIVQQEHQLTLVWWEPHEIKFVADGVYKIVRKVPV